MAHHEPFRSLSPLSWTSDIAPRDRASLTELLTSTLADAQVLIDSIPTPIRPPEIITTSTSRFPSGPGRARSQTDSAAPPSSPYQATTTNANTTSNGGTEHDDGSSNRRNDVVKKLSREWKDLKTHQQQQNPHGIAMYKMSAKDGKGAWFARRSLHRSRKGSSEAGEFEKWEAALRREMRATLDRAGNEPGTGNIRGIGAERRVEGMECEGGSLDLYHVSARFPGPTTPRDFVTLLIMPPAGKEGENETKTRRPRQFMIISRPCDHPDCPPRSGFIRGTYESVEVIREVPIEKPLRRVRSSIDLSRDELQGASDGGQSRMSKEAVLRAAKRAVGDEAESEGEQGNKASFRLRDAGDGCDMEMAIEWLMVTRSDPGGSVPRFMVEKGTPGGIINDAGKFLNWLSSQTMEDLTRPQRSRKGSVDQQETKLTGEAAEVPGQVRATTSVHDQLPDVEVEHREEPAPGSRGIYSFLTSALGAATSAVASTVPSFGPTSKTSHSDISGDESDTSGASFASAEEGSAPHAHALNTTNNSNSIDTISATDGISTRTADSTVSETTSQALSREPTPSAGFTQAQSQHEKELRKLQKRMHKAQEKLERAQARRRAKQSSSNNNSNNSDAAAETDKDKDKEEEALAKLREKHEREVARQEEKYQRELQRLADKRAAEERKTAERRRKAAEREERGNLAMELDRVRAERDVARKEVEMLRETVGELQGQNTMLVARLGKAGVDIGGLNGELKGGVDK